MAKIATLGITLLAFLHSCMRSNCCPGAAKPWSGDDDDDDPTTKGTELVVAMSGQL